MRIALIIIFLLLCAYPATALVVDKDTVWQGDMHFTEDIQVMPGVVLTIKSGSRLYFKEAQLEVSGSIVANDTEFLGDQWEGLLLKGNDSKTLLNNCLIRGAKTGVLVKGGSPTLKELMLVGNKVGVELRGKAAGEIVASSFIDNEKVGLFVKDDSTTSVVRCRFEKNGRYGAYLYHANPGKFEDNLFVKSNVALMVAYHGTNPVVEKNKFEKNLLAIQVDRAARPTIRGNHFLANRTGIHAYRRSDPHVASNRFEGNDVAVLVAYSSYPEIDGNDFIENGLALKLEFQSSEWEAQRGADARAGEVPGRTAFAGQGMRTVTEADRSARNLTGMVNAVGNWWGEVGTAELEKNAAGNPSFIHDGLDQATFVDEGQEYPLDKVMYQPWSQTALTERTQ